MISDRNDQTLVKCYVNLYSFQRISSTQEKATARLCWSTYTLIVSGGESLIRMGGNVNVSWWGYIKCCREEKNEVEIHWLHADQHRAKSDSTLTNSAQSHWLKFSDNPKLTNTARSRPSLVFKGNVQQTNVYWWAEQWTTHQDGSNFGRSVLHAALSLNIFAKAKSSQNCFSLFIRFACKVLI